MIKGSSTPCLNICLYIELLSDRPMYTDLLTHHVLVPRLFAFNSATPSGGVRIYYSTFRSLLSTSSFRSTILTIKGLWSSRWREILPVFVDSYDYDRRYPQKRGKELSRSGPEPRSRWQRSNLINGLREIDSAYGTQLSYAAFRFETSNFLTWFSPRWSIIKATCHAIDATPVKTVARAS